MFIHVYFKEMNRNLRGEGRGMLPAVLFVCYDNLLVMLMLLYCIYIFGVFSVWVTRLCRNRVVFIARFALQNELSKTNLAQVHTQALYLQDCY